MNSFIISNVRVVTPYGIFENGFVYVKRGIIEVIGQSAPGRVHRSCNIIDGQNNWLFPGIIDVHNDSFVRYCSQDMKNRHPLDAAFFALENKLLSHGVTAVYHSIEESMPKIANELIGLRKLGIMRHNLCINQKFDKDFTLISASGILEEIINSSNINLSDIIDNHDVYIICFDSENLSILQSIFALYHNLNISIADTVKMATINPARAMGLDNKYGSIECGKYADLILVSCNDNIPTVETVFVSGCKVFENQFNINGNAI